MSSLKLDASQRLPASDLDLRDRPSGHRQLGSLAEHLIARAEAAPDFLAFASADPSRDVSLSNAELCERASAIAFRLARITLTGDRVLLVYRDPFDFVIAFFACCLAGTIPVPVAPRQGPDTLLAIAQDCGARLALTADERELLAGVQWVRTDDDERRSPFLLKSVDENPVLLQYTSGSTRTPRGVLVTYPSLYATIEDLALAAKHDEQSITVSWLPYYHDMGLVYGILTPLLRGFSAYLMAPEKFVAQPMSWLRAIAATRATHTAAPNFAYALCADRASDLAPGTDLSSLRFALNGAEPIRCHIVRRFEAAFAPFGLRPSVVTPGYGLAEATLKVTSGRCGEGMRSTRFDRDALASGRVISRQDGVELASCGSSLIDTRVRIVDPNTCQPCSPDLVGEIWVAGQTVAGGYWHRPQETQHTFRARLDGEEWLRTGDLGFVHGGSLFVAGRLKDLIIVGGRNFHAHDIEEAISACDPAIRMGRVFAAALDELDGESILVGAEVRSGCDEAAARAVIRVIRSVLMRELDIAPERVVLLRRGGILRTSSGKTRRAATRDALLRGELPIVADDKVRTEDEVLEAIARFVPGATSDSSARLMDLGLDSLSAAKMAASVRLRYGVELTFAKLFRASADDVRREIEAATQAQKPKSEPLPQRDAGLPFDLSEMQQAYWIGQQSGVPLGRVRPHIRVDFEIDAARIPDLGRRLAQLVEHHPALRMKVQTDGRAVVDPHAYDPVIAHRDFRSLDAPTRAERMHALRTELVHDDRHPVVACFTRISEQTAVLHLRLGLLSGDVRSFLLLVRQLAGDEAFEPSPGGVAVASSQAVPGAFRDAWLRRIDTIAPAPELPVAMAASDLTDPRFDTHRQALPEPLSAALAIRARTLGVTLTSLCIAAFVDVLRLWSASHELTLNVTCNTRGQETGQSIGDFTSNTLLSLRESHDSFAACAQAVQRQVWADLDEPWCTGVSMLRELSRRSGSPVLMPVIVTSLLSGDPSDDLASLDALGPVVDMANPTPQVSLHAIFGWRGQSLVMMWESVAQLFPEGLIDAMFASFVEVLETIATTPSSVERRTIAMLDRQQAARRAGTNATEAARVPRRLETLFVAHARACPDAIAVLQGSAATTYGALLRDAEDIGCALQRRGVMRGEVVAAIVEPGARAVATLIGIELAGAVYLPIDPAWPSARTHELLREARASHAVVMRGGADLPLPSLRLDAPLARATLDPVAGLTPGEVAYVIFTSGSTGRPKGVLVTHEAAANTIDDINARFSVGSADRALCVSSLAFDLSVYDIFGMLAAGGAVVFPEDSRDPESIGHALLDGAVTIWNSVPAVLELVLDVTVPRSPDLRLVLLSGDWIAPALAVRLREVFPQAQPISLGGATEASIWSVIHPIVPSDAALVSIPYGKPLSNQQCFVRAPDGRERPDGVAGELLLGGHGLALAYCGNEEETARRFFIDADGRRLYRTGDLARWLPSGELELLGRIDHQVKVQGYRIELGEIEAAAMRAGCISRAVASVVPRSGAMTIQLHVVASPQPVVDDIVAAVRAELVLHLPVYMQPHYVAVIDALPLTANGKLDRSRLPGSPAPRLAAAARHDASLETAMLDAFTEVVGLDIDPQQAFFDAGATSIHIVRLRALLLSRGVVVPPLVDFFSLATIRALASRLAVSDVDAPKPKDLAHARAYRQRMRSRKEAL